MVDSGAAPSRAARMRALPRRVAAWSAVPAGWALAIAVPASAASSAGAAGVAASRLVLAAVLAWWVAVVVTVRSDLRRFIIPDEASAATAALGLAVACGVPLLEGDGPAEAGRAALGALSTGAGCFALFWLVDAAFRRLGRDALGFGDVKLAGAAGLWLTPADAAMALEIAALGAIAALLARPRAGRLRDTPVPFGAFLAPAAWLVFVLAPLLRGEAGP